MRDNREFARIPACIVAGVRPLDEQQLEQLRQSLLEKPSIWSPSGEATLRDMVTGGTGEQAILARAILDLCEQIVCLRSRVLEAQDELASVEVIQLSGGGGQMRTRLPLHSGDLLEIRFNDDDEMPPIRAAIKVVHEQKAPEVAYGFSFQVIHPRDHERLVRLIYTLQRRALRHNQAERLRSHN